jgi:hypothetical protein
MGTTTISVPKLRSSNLPQSTIRRYTKQLPYDDMNEYIKAGKKDERTRICLILFL